MSNVLDILVTPGQRGRHFSIFVADLLHYHSTFDEFAPGGGKGCPLPTPLLARCSLMWMKGSGTLRGWGFHIPSPNNVWCNGTFMSPALLVVQGSQAVWASSELCRWICVFGGWVRACASPGSWPGCMLLPATWQLATLRDAHVASWVGNRDLPCVLACTVPFSSLSAAP